MAPGIISNRVIVERMAWINKMIYEIGQLPLENYATFVSDKRNVWAAESCLRRTLEALMDLGRHRSKTIKSISVALYENKNSGMQNETKKK